MLFCICLQVPPQVIGQGVFGIYEALGVIEESIFIPLKIGFTSVCTVEDFCKTVRVLGW